MGCSRVPRLRRASSLLLPTIFTSASRVKRQSAPAWSRPRSTPSTCGTGTALRHAELPHQEQALIDEIAQFEVEEGSRILRHGVDAEQHGLLRAGRAARGLKRSRHLARVEAGDFGLSGHRREQHRGIARACLHAVVRRVAQQPFELLRVVCRSVLAGPVGLTRVLVVAQHVEYRAAEDRGAKELGALGHRRGRDERAV